MRSPTTIAIVVLMIVSGPLVSATRAQGPNRADGGASAASQSSSKTADASASPATILAEIIKALAWPVSALIMAVVFRRPLNAFLGALGTRVNKLSVFKVELELTPAKSATSTPLLDEIRAVTTAAPIADSAATLLEQVQMATPADYATIHLGHGDEWLTSRLFIAATMLERMRGLQVLVFVESVDTIDRRLLAVVPVAVVRWALARRYPYLEA